MSLTMGTGLFGHAPAGAANHELPRDLIYTEPSPRRIRAVLDGETVLDSRRARLVFRHGQLPRYFVPRADVGLDRLGDVTPVEPPPGAPGLEDHVALPWDAMDAWYEEDDEQLAHAPDPYHRVDVRATSRHVRISLTDPPRPNLAWTYPDPRPEVGRLRDRIAFFDEQVDGEPVERPQSPWAHPRWFDQPGPER